MNRTNSAAVIRRRLGLSTALGAGLLAASPALAQPVPGTVPTGMTVGAQSNSDTITSGLAGSTLNVNLGNNRRSILNWGSFSLASNRNVAFNSTVPGAENAYVLNRDLSGAMSEIYGTITGPSNLKVFILNPNGVLFGNTAVVNVGGLVAGSLGLADADFMDTNASFNFTGTATTSVGVLNGAQITTTAGPLVLIAGTVSNAGTLTANGDVALVAASNVTLDIEPGSPLSMTITSGTPISGGVVAGGTINGQNVYMAAVGRSGVTDALLNVSGIVTATGATATDRGIVLTSGTDASGITVTGSPDTSGSGAVTLSGSLASAKDVELRSSTTVGGTGAIDAGGSVTGSAGTSFSTGRISAANAISLTATSIGSGSSDLNIEAGGAVTLTGNAKGRDVAIKGDTVSVTGTIAARDDIAIRANGLASTGALSSGVSVDALAAVDVNGAADTLVGGALAGNDIDIEADGLTTGQVIATGTGSDVRLNGGATGIGSGAAVLDIQAGGNITLSSAARGEDVILNAAGSVATGALTSRDDIFVTGGTSVIVGALETGATVDSLAPTDAPNNGIASIVAGTSVTVNAAGTVRGDAYFEGQTIGGAGLSGTTFNRDLNFFDTLGTFDVDVNLTAAGSILLQAQGGALNLSSTVTSTGGAVTLDAAGGSSVVLNGGTVNAATRIDVLDNALVDDAVTLTAPIVDFAGTINGTGVSTTDRLTINSSTRTEIGGGVGNSDALGALTINGPLLLQAGNIVTEAGLTLGSVSIANNTLLDAGNGNLTISGPLTSSVAGVTVTLDAETRNNSNQNAANSIQSIFIGDIGVTDQLLGNVTILQDARLTGSIRSGGIVRTEGDLVLAGTGDSTITAASAVLGDGQRDDIWALSSTTQGLAVVVTGSASFGGDVGRSDARLRAFGLSANSVSSNFLLGNGVNAGTIAASVQTGDLVLTSSSNLSIGSVGAISGLNATNGSVLVSTSGSANLSIGGAVTAFGDVTLQAGGTLSGSANITAGVNNVAMPADVLLTAGGALTVGNVQATDDIVINATGLVTTGTLTAGFGAAILDDDVGDPELGGGSVKVTGNGIRPGAIVVDDNITLVSTGGNVGSAGNAFSLTAPGRINVTGTIVGTTVDINSINSTISIGDVNASSDATIVAQGNLDMGSIDAANILVASVNGNVTGGALRGSLDVYAEAANGSLSVGAVDGIDVVLRSTNGNINAGVIRARDDFLALSTGSFSAISLTSGATIGGNGPTERSGFADGVYAVDWTGNDTRIEAALINPGSVRANGANSDILLTATTAAGVGDGSRDLELIAGGNIAVSGAARGRDIALSAGGTVGTGDLTARDDIVVRAGTSATLGNVVNGVTVDSLAATDVNGAADTLAAATLTGNDVNLRAGTTLSYGAGSSVANDLTVQSQETSGPFTIAGGDLTIIDTLGNLTIETIASNGALTVEARGGSLSVGNAALVGPAGVISANGNIALSAGGGAGNITLAGNVTNGTAAGRTLTLTALGSISQTGGIITTDRVTGSAAGAVILNNLNQIARFGTFNAGSLQLRTASGLTVDGTVNGGSFATLISGGDLALNAGVTTTGTLFLTSGGNITQTAAFSAGALTGSATGSATLDNAANSFPIVSGFTANGLRLRSNSAIELTGSAVSGGAGGVVVQAGAGNLLVNANVGATGTGAIDLLSSGSITIGAGRTVSTGTGAILIDASGPVTSSGLVSTGGTVQVNADGNVRILGGAGAGISGNGVTIDANLDGSGIRFEAPVSAGTGALSLTAEGLVTQTTAGVLTAGSLTVNTTGAALLSAADNLIGTLGNVTSTAFTLRDLGGLTVTGPVVGTDGVSIVTDGALTVNGAVSTTDALIQLVSGAGTALALNAAVNAGAGPVLLQGGSVSQSAAGVITTGELSGFFTGTAILDTAANSIASLADFNASQLALRTTGALSITGQVVTNGATNPGVSIQAAGISQAAGSLINAGTQTIRLDADGGAVALAGELRTTSAAANAVAIVDATTVSLGNVRAGAGTLVLGEAGAAIGGAITQADGTSIEAGRLTALATGNPITLLNAGNSIAALGPVTAASLLLRDDVGGLAIDGNQSITGTLELQVANGPVTQAAGTTISAALLRGTSNGGATFGAAGNTIASVGPWTNSGAGGFTLVTSGALNVAGDIAAGTGLLTLSATGISGTGRTLSAGGPVTITASTGGITLGAVNGGTGATTLTATNGTVDVTNAVTGGSVTASGQSVLIGSATASSGALTLTASSGQLRLGGGSAANGATLTKQGTTGDLELTNALAVAAGNATVTTATSARIGSITATTGNIAVTANTAANGSVTGTGTGAAAGASLSAPAAASTVTVLVNELARLNAVDAGTVRVDAAQLDLSGIMTGRTAITLNNIRTSNKTSLGSVAGTTGFALSQAEMDFIRAPTVTINSNANDIEIGNLNLGSTTGNQILNVYTTGRIDVTGKFETTAAVTPARTIQLGGTATADGRASVMTVVTKNDGSAAGRLLFEGAILDLRAAKIGVGQDQQFLDSLGLMPGGTPLATSDVANNFIGNGSSTLYRAVKPYGADEALVKAGALKVSYTDYALFQNTALPSARPSGVVLAGTIRPMLELLSSGDTAQNAFAIFAEIDGRRGLEAAILPPDFIKLTGVNRGNTRINGCLAGSGSGGCIVSTVAQPLINPFDAGRADVLSAAGELPITFDPIVGANNEALFAGLSAIEDIATEGECKPEDGKPCPAPERN